ncbi:MAG TPA: SIMPL domain-containing protein [Rectinemataceae bacterium]|nr:SIMPL domain-containing protein [Rectinemataceae bacterium]
MKKSISLALLALAVFAVGAQTAPQTLPQTPTVRVTGEATASVEADMALLNLAIVQQAKTSLAAREAVMASADKVISSLLALGIDKKMIRTSNFRISPVYDERPAKQNLIIGYKGETGVTVTLEDTELVAQAVETAVNAGANEIRGLDYRKKNEDILRVETLRKAVANAAQKAQAMAETLGRRLGKAISVEEQGYSMRAPDSRLYLAKSMGAGSQEAFSPGSVEVNASVSIVFEME